MYARYDKYIDTNVDGLVFDIEHNLKTMMPLVFLYEPVGLTDLRSISLYDSRIGFIESKGLNVSRLSFNSSFQGYVSLVDVKNTKPGIEDRMTKLESMLSIAIQQQKSFTTLSQWKEMNNFAEQELETVKTGIQVLQKQLDSLKEDIENL